MNKQYRVVYNRRRGLMQAVSEHARSRGMSCSVTEETMIRRCTATLLGVFMAGAASFVFADKITADGDVNPALPDTNPDVWYVPGYYFDIGSSSYGRLTISEGGEVASNASSLGVVQSGHGVVEITGTGSKWQVGASEFIIGRYGHGELSVENGGLADIGAYVQIGYHSVGTGSLIVKGPASKLIGARDINVGINGQGSMRIDQGGVINNDGNGKVGHWDGGIGNVTILGQDSRWDIGTYLLVGDMGDSQGTATLVDGGTLKIGNQRSNQNYLRLGVEENSVGRINIGAAGEEAAAAPGVLDAGEIRFGNGRGTLNFNHNDDISFAADLISEGSGAHALNHVAGATTLTGDSSSFQGTTTISGGTLFVGGSDGSGTLGGAIHVSEGATLGGLGIVGSPAEVVTIGSGANLSPGVGGNQRVGTLVINGDLILDQDSTVHYRLGQAGPMGAPEQGISDRIGVQGNLTLDGALSLTQSGHADDGVMGSGYYRLMTYSGNLSGHGLQIENAPALPDDAYYEIQAGDGYVDMLLNKSDNTLQHWQGGDGVWGDAQWLNQNGNIQRDWAGHVAIFKNEPGGFDGGTIDVDGMNSFEGIQFVNDGYRLEGGGSLDTGDVDQRAEVRVLSDSAHIATTITGDGALAKTEKGTLVLSGTNTYRGGTHLLDGTVSISADENLGDADGALYFDGGGLQITGLDLTELDRQIEWGDRAGYFDIADYADDHFVTVSGDLIGAGTLVKRGEGALRLTGTNDYGNTFIQEGNVHGDTQSISGDVHIVDGAVFFEQDSDSTFAGNLTTDDNETVTAVKDGVGTLSLSGHSSVDWWVEQGELRSSAERFTGYAGLNADATLTFDQTQDASYHNVLEGYGHFRKTGAGLLQLTGDSSRFLGITTIDDGTLSVGGTDGHGRLGGTMLVSRGGTLTGTGGVGTPFAGPVTVAGGGTLAPGNSIGTLAVHGDLVFRPGSRYVVEVDPDGTGSDHVMVRGHAMLDGGTVVHTGLPGSYSPDARYRILTAETGLAGTFDDVTSSFAFLEPTLDYDYGNFSVDLRLQRNEVGIASLAQTPNQRATARGLESLPVDNEVMQQVLTLPNDTPATVFDGLSGEIHASVASALQAGGNTTQALSLSRLHRNLVEVPLHETPLWADVTGNWLDLDGDGNAASLRQSTQGVFIGGDHDIGAGWRLGMALGYTDSRMRVRDRDSRADVDTYSAAVYGGKSFELESGQLNVMVGGGYSHHRIKTRRTAALNDWNHTLKASYRGHTHQMFGEIGYAFPVGNATLEPFAGVAWSRLRTQSFDESGGPTALSGQSENSDMTTSTLGLRASLEFDADEASGRVYGSLGWQHAYGRVEPKRSLAFDGGQPFTVAGTPLARDSAVTELGVDMSLSPQTRLGVAYQGRWGGGIRDHSASVNVLWSF